MTLFVSCASVQAQQPMTDVIALLDNDGGVKTGENSKDGFYIVSLAFSDDKSEQKAKELARLEATRQLNEYLNGTKISGKSIAIEDYRKSNTKQGLEETSYSRSSNMVQSIFKGKVNSAKTIKQGIYKKRYFVALSITETDSQQKTRLLSKEEKSQPLLANKNNKVKTVSASGLASLKSGKKKARDNAIQDALRNAVQQANGVAIKSKTGRFNNALTMIMSSKIQGYIRSYEVLSEKTTRGEYNVEIVADVDQAKLVGDVQFFIGAFSSPTFNLSSNDSSIANWFVDELEVLGFVISKSKNTSHSFHVSLQQKNITNHLNKPGSETEVVITLKDNNGGEQLFTIRNLVNKSRIYVEPSSRSQNISKKAALSAIKKILPVQLFEALAAAAERGSVYQIILTQAKRSDLNLFKLAFNSGTDGSIESWKWHNNEKTITLDYRYSGALSEAMEEGLPALYNIYKQEMPNRRPHAISIDNRQAKFTLMIN